MTPAINAAKQAQIDFQIYEYAHDPSCESYGEEAAAKIGIDANRVFKTLVVSPDGMDLAVAVLPVSRQLDLKLFAKNVGAKKAVMAGKKDAERATGYMLGGISPIGQKKRLTTLIDKSAMDYETIFVSAGRRGLEIELTPGDLRALTHGRFVQIGK